MFWSSEKASHAALLFCMEQGEISSGLETEKIDRVQGAHTQRDVSTHTSDGHSDKWQNYTICLLQQEFVFTEGHS